MTPLGYPMYGITFALSLMLARAWRSGPRGEGITRTQKICDFRGRSPTQTSGRRGWTLVFLIYIIISNSTFAQCLPGSNKSKSNAGDIDATVKKLLSQYEVSLEPFSPCFQWLINKYAPEYEEYHLDEIVVAAIVPIVWRMVVTWKILHFS